MKITITRITSTKQQQEQAYILAGKYAFLKQKLGQERAQAIDTFNSSIETPNKAIIKLAKINKRERKLDDTFVKQLYKLAQQQANEAEGFRQEKLL